jgi:hypothetical protein
MKYYTTTSSDNISDSSYRYCHTDAIISRLKTERNTTMQQRRSSSHKRQSGQLVESLELRTEQAFHDPNTSHDELLLKIADALDDIPKSDGRNQELPHNYPGFEYDRTIPRNILGWAVLMELHRGPQGLSPNAIDVMYPNGSLAEAEVERQVTNYGAWIPPEDQIEQITWG